MRVRRKGEHGHERRHIIYEEGGPTPQTQGTKRQNERETRGDERDKKRKGARYAPFQDANRTGRASCRLARLSVPTGAMQWAERTGDKKPEKGQKTRLGPGEKSHYPLLLGGVQRVKKGRHDARLERTAC